VVRNLVSRKVKKADDGKGKWQGKAQDGKKKFVKPSFVKPWPENSPYVGKNGNNLTKELEQWFKIHCVDTRATLQKNVVRIQIRVQYLLYVRGADKDCTTTVRARDRICNRQQC
jgi:hypothetical protein